MASRSSCAAGSVLGGSYQEFRESSTNVDAFNDEDIEVEFRKNANSLEERNVTGGERKIVDGNCRRLFARTSHTEKNAIPATTITHQLVHKS